MRYCTPLQGRSHVFESEGAQSSEAIMGPSYTKKWEGQSILLLLYGPKSGGGPGPSFPLGDYDPVDIQVTLQLTLE